MNTLQGEALSARIEEGVKTAIAEAIQEHKKAGHTIVVSRNGKIVYLKADEIPEK